MIDDLTRTALLDVHEPARGPLTRCWCAWPGCHTPVSRRNTAGRPCYCAEHYQASLQQHADLRQAYSVWNRMRRQRGRLVFDGERYLVGETPLQPGDRVQIDWGAERGREWGIVSAGGVVDFADGFSGSLRSFLGEMVRGEWQT